MEFRVSNIRMAIDPETGEVDEHARIITKEMDEAIARDKARNKVIEIEFEKYGRFYWLFYDIQEALFNGKIDGITATRLMYLATYLSYKDNTLIYDNKQPVLTGQLPGLLKLGRTACYNFLKKFEDSGLINVRPDKTIVVSKEYFARGKLSKRQIYDKRYIMRIYINTIRYLYDNSEDRYKNNLSYLYTILPWVNRNFNIVSKNPLEKELDKIEPMTTAEFCEAIGVSSDKKQCQRLRHALIPIRINGQATVSWVFNANGDRIFINPKVYYAGTEAERVEILGQF